MGPGSDEVNEVEQLRAEIDESRENLGAAVGALAYKADVKNRGKEAISDKKEAVMEKVDDLKSKVPGVGGGSESGAGDESGGIGEKVKSKLPSGEQVSGKVDELKAKLPSGGEGEGGGIGEKAKSVGDAAPSKDELKGKARDAADSARNNPAAVAAGAAAAGLAAGLALPQTDLEREKLNPKAQQMRADAEARAKDAVEQAKSTARSVEQLKSVAQDVAGSAISTAREQGQQQDGKVGDALEAAADKAEERVDPQSG
jgi:hypothetical protein